MHFMKRRPQYQNWLIPYLEGILDEHRRSEMRERLKADPALAAEAESLRRTLARLRSAAVEVRTEQETSPAQADLWPRIEARLPSAPAPREIAPALRWGAACVLALIAAIALALPRLHPAPPNRPQAVPAAQFARRLSPPALRKLSPPATPPLEKRTAARTKTAPALTLPDPFRPPERLAATPRSHPELGAPVRIARALPPTSMPQRGPAEPYAVDASARMSPPAALSATPQKAAPVKSDENQPLAATTPPAPSPINKAAGTDHALSVDALRRQLARAPAASPARVATLRELADTYLASGDTRLALDSWQAALETTALPPLYGDERGDSQAEQTLSEVQQVGRLAALRANLERRQGQRPQDIVLSRILASVYTHDGDPAKALAEWQRIIRTGAASAEDWFQMAQTAEKSGDIAAASVAYRHVLDDAAFVPPSPTRRAYIREHLRKILPEPPRP